MASLPHPLVPTSDPNKYEGRLVGESYTQYLLRVQPSQDWLEKNLLAQRQAVRDARDTVIGLEAALARLYSVIK